MTSLCWTRLDEGGENKGVGIKERRSWVCLFSTCLLRSCIRVISMWEMFRMPRCQRGESCVEVNDQRKLILDTPSS